MRNDARFCSAPMNLGMPNFGSVIRQRMKSERFAIDWPPGRRFSIQLEKRACFQHIEKRKRFNSSFCGHRDNPSCARYRRKRRAFRTSATTASQSAFSRRFAWHASAKLTRCACQTGVCRKKRENRGRRRKRFPRCHRA